MAKREIVTLLLLMAILAACGRSQPRVVEGSFAIALVETNSAPLSGTNTAIGSSDRLVAVHPSFVTSSSPRQYRLEDRALLGASDLESAMVIETPQIKLTRSQYEEGIKRYGKDKAPGMSYEEVRNYNERRHPEIVLTFNEAGKIKFAEITRQYVGRQLAIIVGDRVINAPIIKAEIPGGVAVVQGDFTVAEAHAIVDTIYRKQPTSSQAVQRTGPSRAGEETNQASGAAGSGR